MPLTAVVCGLLLIGIGIVGYTISDADNPVTALIPAGWGLLLMVPGLVALAKESTRKHAMHAAATIGLIGFVLAAGRLAMVLVRGGGSTLGQVSLAGMAIICLVFVILCVRSFTAARRSRTP